MAPEVVLHHQRHKIIVNQCLGWHCLIPLPWADPHTLSPLTWTWVNAPEFVPAQQTGAHDDWRAES